MARAVALPFYLPGCSRNPANQRHRRAKERLQRKEDVDGMYPRLSNAITVQSRQMTAVAIFQAPITVVPDHSKRLLYL